MGNAEAPLSPKQKASFTANLVENESKEEEEDDETDSDTDDDDDEDGVHRKKLVILIFHVFSI